MTKEDKQELCELFANAVADKCRPQQPAITGWLPRWLPLILVVVSIVASAVTIKAELKALATHLNEHMEDAHPQTVIDMIQVEREQRQKLEAEVTIWREAGMPFLLIELRAELKNMNSTIEQIKKNMELN